MKIAPIVLVSILLLATLIALPAWGQYTPPHTKPGPAADRIIFRAFAVDIAPLSLQNNEMDIYFFSLRTPSARELEGKPGVQVLRAPASMVSIILNPAPAPKGELNPFSIREVRFALQYALDRDFVAAEIYRGLGVAMVTHVSPLDFDFLTIQQTLREKGILFDPEQAKQLITQAMSKAGAKLQDGKWTFEGKPIRLKFIVRVEDERKDVGDLFAAQLEKLGFIVERIFQQFGPAIQKVYSTDPQVFEWHLYTEGWGRGSAERYDYATLNQMCAPWLGNMPGWQEVGFWQYENKLLDELGQRIFKGEYTSQQERDQLYSRAVSACSDESVRLWTATVVNNFPATLRISGLSMDVTAGPKGIWTLREAHVPGKNDLVVGNLWVWTERTTWNPIGGFGDVFSADIWRAMNDPPMARHPFTGLPIAFRVVHSVETAGPNGKLKVPEDALTWDPSADRWSRVPAGTEAISKVTFDYKKYFASKWHHGQPITMADVLYGIHQAFEIAFDASKSQVEFALAVTSKPYLETFKGFRVVDDSKLEVYVNYWHFIPDFIAEYSSVAGLSMPWEILAAMDELVFAKRLGAYSDTAAAKFNVPWLSLVMAKDARLVSRTLSDFLSKSTLPEGVFSVGGKSYSTKEEAANRYKASIAWFEANNILVISNGPYKLTRFDPGSQFAQLDAFRDLSYPFKPGDWFFGAAKGVQILASDAPQLSIGAGAKVGVSVKGPGRLGLRYALLDPATGRLVQTGEASQVTEGAFEVVLPAELTSKLKQGRYQLTLTAFSSEVSSLAERTIVLEAVERMDSERPPQPPPVITTPTERVTAEPSSDRQRASQPSTNVPLIIGGAVGGVAVAVVAALLLRRRRA